MRRSTPPGPRGYLDFARLSYRHYLMMRWDPVRFLRWLGRKYGDLCRFTMFGYECYLVNHPALIREVLVRHADDVRKFPRVMNVLREAIGASVLTTEGETWRDRRSMLQRVFRRIELDRVAQLTTEETTRWCSRLGDQTVVSIEQQMNGVLQSTVARFLFGADLRDGRAVSEAVREYSDRFYRESKGIMRCPSWLPSRGRARQRACLELVQREIRELSAQRANAPADGSDVLQLLSAAVAAESSVGIELGRREALDELITLFVAGSHTSSVAAAWAWYLIAGHADVQQRIVAEVDAVTGGRELAPEDGERLEYTRMVVEESLRLYPAAWELFGRQIVRPFSLREYELPAGSLVFILPVVTQRDERFFPDPLRFDPDRFSRERRESIDSFAYIPFGAGPHTCLGKTMTLVQLPLLIAGVLQHYRVGLIDSRPISTVARVSLRPKFDIRLELRRRRRGGVSDVLAGPGVGGEKKHGLQAST